MPLHKKALATAANVTGGIAAAVDTASFFTHDAILPHISLVGGIATDALNLSREFKDKRRFWKDFGIDMSHYLPIMTQFFPLTTPLALLTLSLTGGLGVYQLSDDHFKKFIRDPLNTVPLLLSAIRSFSTQARLVLASDTHSDVTFGSSYYGRLASHPKLQSYHADMIRLKREFAEVPLGISKLDHLGYTHSYSINNKYRDLAVSVNLSKNRESAYEYEESFSDQLRYTVMHEYAHVDDKLIRNANPSLGTRSLHNQEFQTLHTNLYRLASEQGMLTPSWKNLVHKWNNSLTRSGRMYELVDINNLANRTHRGEYELVSTGND